MERLLLVPILCAYVFLGLCFGDLRLWNEDGVRFIHERVSYLLAFGLGIYFLRQWKLNKLTFEEISKMLVPSLSLPIACLGVVLISDYLARDYIFFPGTETRSFIVFFGAALLLIFWRAFHDRESQFTSALYSRKTLLALQCLICILFWRSTEGKLIFSDDHPSFLYRLQLLRDHFPHIPFYNTQWNGGHLARDFFATGVLSVFFFVWPFLLFANNFSTIEGARLYTLFIPYMFVFVVPWCVYVAARIIERSKPESTIAAILALGPSLGFFEWLLKYGTVGFCMFAGLLPLLVSISCRTVFANRREPSWKEIGALLVVAMCCFSWPLAVLAVLPLGVFLIVYRQDVLSPQRRIKIGTLMLAVLICFSPWLKMFASPAELEKFLTRTSMKSPSVSANPAPATHAPEWGKKVRKTLQRAHEVVVKVNPLILIFCLPGFILLGRSRYQTVYFGMCAWLLLLVLLNALKPQLELQRMIIPLSYLCCLVSAVAVFQASNVVAEALVTGKAKSRQLTNVALAVILFGTVGFSPMVVGSAYSNRSSERFITEPELLAPLTQALREHGGNGRIFVLGFILHDFGSANMKDQDGGHIAPLPEFVGKPFYAFDYVHKRWFSVDPIPKSFRDRDEEGVEEFLDLVNATSVVAFTPVWRDYCEHMKDKYTEVFRAGRFRVYSRKESANGYFAQGQGAVTQETNGLHVRLESADAILKFRFLPGLNVEPSESATLESVKMFDEEVDKGKTSPVYFIRLRNQTDHPVDMRIDY